MKKSIDVIKSTNGVFHFFDGPEEWTCSPDAKILSCSRIASFNNFCQLSFPVVRISVFCLSEIPETYEKAILKGGQNV